jgi:hypothetical protein
MALMTQDPALHSGPSRIPAAPYYEREANDARLKLRSNEFLADSSRLYPRVARVKSGPRLMGSRTKC